MRVDPRVEWRCGYADADGRARPNAVRVDGLSNTNYVFGSGACACGC